MWTGNVVGTCGNCGGAVRLPLYWLGVVPPVPRCESCGATTATSPYGPVLPMTPVRPLGSPVQSPSGFRDMIKRLTRGQA